jgi:hypothetical protein
MNIKDTDKGFLAIKKALLSLKNKEIKVGIHPEAGKNAKTGTLIVDYATANEYGTSKIPERSFMRSTVDEKQQEWNKALDRIVGSITEGDISNIEQKISFVAEQMVNDIKEKIDSNVPPPLSEATKKRKGSSRTLIDTGIMRASITYKVEN